MWGFFGAGFWAKVVPQTLQSRSENIIAFLLTNNIYNVIDTISSRCQKIILDNNVKREFSEEVEEFSKVLDEKKRISFGYIDQKIYSMEKEQLIKFLKELENLYIYRLNECTSIEEDLHKISKKITIIDESLKKLRYNVNIKLFIDEFILSISEVIWCIK